MAPKKNSNGEIEFSDYPNFRPNLTPRQIFKKGSFGGTYWRAIQSNVTGESYENQHKKYPRKWWENIPEDALSRPWDEYDKTINNYGVHVGTTLEEWEGKKWITELHPYGWVQWYCDFYMGERGPDDKRQIGRWISTAGPNSRFRKRLVNMIHDQNTTFDDFSISPKIRQTLQHWGYRLTRGDVDE